MSGHRLVPTLRELAMLADGERAVLVAPDGEIGWGCFPSFDGDPLFNSLLGGPGGYALTPRGRFTWGGFYEEGTLIWHSRWVLDDGAIVETREALAMPAGPERLQLLRAVSVERGEATAFVRLNPRPRFGQEALRWRRDDDGSWRGSGAVEIGWRGVPEARLQGSALVAEISLSPGEVRHLVLDVSTRPAEEDAAPAGELWRRTERAWSDSVPRLDHCAGRRDAREAAAVLHGLTRTRTGGMVAAATTSIAEGADTGRSFDYRYVWVRDQVYAGLAADAAGLTALRDRLAGFLVERVLADGPGLCPVYRSDGGRLLPRPEEVEHLPGYPGGETVRVGNRAGEQFQVDAFGEVLLLLFACAADRGLDRREWRAIEVAAEAIGRRAAEPDAGIWETDPKEWTHGRLICCAGLRRVAGLPRLDPALSRQWNGVADAILERCQAVAVRATGGWRRAKDDDRTDAALLLPALRGALPPDHPRSEATFHDVMRELATDLFCYRYRHGEGPLGEAEGAFTICSFWVALSLQERDEPVRAGRWFERARASCGPPGLHAEEYDVRERQMRGNIPQAFVHAALLEAAARLGTEGVRERR